MHNRFFYVKEVLLRERGYVIYKIFKQKNQFDFF